MPFEKFVETGRGYKPKISISRSGLIGFNNGAVKRFNLQNYEYIILYYDKENQKIGIQPTNDENEEGLRRLRKRTSGADISARSFFDYFNIDYKKTNRYDAIWSDEDSMIVLYIKKI